MMQIANKQYQISIKNRMGDIEAIVVCANDWSEIPAVVERDRPGWEVFEYEHTPLDFAERYPELAIS